MIKPCFVVALHLVCATLALARTGVVRTRDGHTYQGRAFLDAAGNVTVVPLTGLPLRVPLSSLAQVTFSSGDPRTDAAPPGSVPGAPPAPWIRRQIGPFGLPGNVNYILGSFIIQGSGLDSFYFVCQPLPDHGEIVANLTSFQNNDPLGTAGVMLRQALTEDSPFVLLAATAANRGVLQNRATTNKNAQTSLAVDLAVPGWLKLTRTGPRVALFGSTNGQKWLPIGNEMTCPIGPSFIGLAVASHSNQLLSRALFENVTVTATALKEGIAQAVILRNGTTLAAVIQSVDEIMVKFVSQGRSFSLPLIEVARLQWRDIPPERLAALPPGRRGALLANGDFFDGEIARLDNQQVKINSVRFGSRTFNLVNEVATVVLRDRLPSTAPWQVRAADGTVLLSKTINVEIDKLILQDQTVGLFRLRFADVVEIKRLEK